MRAGPVLLRFTVVILALVTLAYCGTLSAFSQPMPQDDREIDCRNPQEAAQCRELQGSSGRLQTSRPAAQAPVQNGLQYPSFNCARASTAIEQAICSDATLAQWDARMGQLYRQALSIQNNSPTLKANQGRWRAQRDGDCRGPDLSEIKTCVLGMTKARVGGLAAVITANGGTPNSFPPIATGPASAATVARRDSNATAPATAERTPDPNSIIVSISVTASPTNPPVIMGATNLPDGTHLMVTLRGEPPACLPRCGIGPQSTTVANGRFTVGSELTGGKALISGSYTVEIVTPMASIQPQNVQSVIGKSGERLRGPYVVTLEVGGQYVPVRFPRSSAPSAGEKLWGLTIRRSERIFVAGDQSQDAAARAQAIADYRKWSMENCASSVDFVNAAVRSGVVKGSETLGAERQAKIDVCIADAELQLQTAGRPAGK